jgi:hypothetical protein
MIFHLVENKISPPCDIIMRPRLEEMACSRRSYRNRVKQIVGFWFFARDMRKDKEPYVAGGDHMVQELRLEVGRSSWFRRGLGRETCDKLVGKIYGDRLPVDDHFSQRGEVELPGICFNCIVKSQDPSDWRERP